MARQAPALVLYLCCRNRSSCNWQSKMEYSNVRRTFCLVLAFCIIPVLAVGQDYRKAEKYFAAGNYSKALDEAKPLAEQGDARAQFLIGLMYALGRGVPQSYSTSAKWYRLAAGQGLATAAYNLGLAYYNGLGVPKDYVTAYMWMNVAATNGNQAAAHSRDEAAKKMKPSEIAVAQDRTGVCLASKYKHCD
jgi:uncharacterized protein